MKTSKNYNKYVQPHSSSNSSFKSKRVRPTRKKSKKLKPNSKGAGKSKTKLAGAKNWRKNSSLNNISFDKKRLADQEIAAKNKKKKKISQRRRRLKLGLATVAVFTVYLLLVNFSNKRADTFVSLKMDRQLGGLEDSEYFKNIQTSVSEELSSGIAARLEFPSWRFTSIEQAIITKNPEVSDVSLSFSWIKMRTEARVTSNAPLVSWVSPEGDISYVNQSGQIFTPPGSLVSFVKPLQVKGAGLGVSEGSSELSPSNKLAWAVKTTLVLKLNGIEPSSINIDGRTLKSLEFLIITGAVNAESGIQEQVRVVFSTEEDPERSGVSAARAIKHLLANREGGIMGLQYIDVKTPQRVLYK